MAAGAAAAGSACRADLAELHWADGQARFAVEVADDLAERSKGLMNRAELPRGSGMLFVYDVAQPVAFWMDNTLIPLDMIFFDESGTAVKVHAQAVPMDRTPIPSDAPVRYVLEINGGLAARIGIEPGTFLRHPAVNPAMAALPCP